MNYAPSTSSSDMLGNRINDTGGCPLAKLGRASPLYQQYQEQSASPLLNTSYHVQSYSHVDSNTPENTHSKSYSPYRTFNEIDSFESYYRSNDKTTDSTLSLDVFDNSGKSENSIVGHNCPGYETFRTDERKTPENVIKKSPEFERFFNSYSQAYHRRCPTPVRFVSYQFYQNDQFGNNAHNSSSDQYSLSNEQMYEPNPSNVTDLQPSCNYIVDQIQKLGRSSPNLDQGYHTLVSPSPGPWIDYNTKNVFKGKTKVAPKNNYFTMLPDSAVLKIFAWLNSSELCVLARVCRRFQHLIWEPTMWRTVNLKGADVLCDKAIRCIFNKLAGPDPDTTCLTVEKVFMSEGARVSEKGLFMLARRCSELTHLQVQGCQALTNTVLCHLMTGCHNLQHLDLTGCARLSAFAGPELSRKFPLQYLDLTDCTSIDDHGLRTIVGNCPQLMYLYLRRCVQITDAGIKCVPSFCSALRELSVSDCANLTDFGLYELAKLGATLRYLSVAKCDRVSDPGLKVIVRRCYKLRYLNTRGCEAVSDDAIVVLARSCPRLRALDVGKCDISDAGLAALAECCPNLKKLSLRNCELITDKGVQCIAYYCRGLQLLNIQDCQITVEGYRAVKKYCKRCVIEHTNPGFF